MNAVTTEAQREEVLALVSETTEWLDDEGFDCETEKYLEKKKNVEGLAEPIFERMAEAEARPKAIADAEKRLSDIRALMKKWEKSMPQVTEGEREDVFSLCSAAEKWIEEKKEAQVCSSKWLVVRLGHIHSRARAGPSHIEDKPAPSRAL